MMHRLAGSSPAACRLGDAPAEAASSAWPGGVAPSRRAGVPAHASASPQDDQREHGSGDVGAVAGATAPEALGAVRVAPPHAFIVVSGYGARGGDARDPAGLRAGRAAGVVVNSSRSIIYAWWDSDREYAAAAAIAARNMCDELVGVLGA